MRFTLKYRGEDLKSSGNSDGRIREKQILRGRFHTQVKNIWENHNSLRNINRKELQEPTKVADRFEVARPIQGGLAGILFRHKVHNSWFVPMITGPMEAYCHLALRVGRPTKPGQIVFSGGDLDGRLKTLFDSLAIPKNEEQVKVGDCTQEEYLCLLSDDSLITGLSIESYELLDAYPENYIDIDLSVTITAITPMNVTMDLLFGG